MKAYVGSRVTAPLIIPVLLGGPRVSLDSFGVDVTFVFGHVREIANSDY